MKKMILAFAGMLLILGAGAKDFRPLYTSLEMEELKSERTQLLEMGKEPKRACMAAKSEVQQQVCAPWRKIEQQLKTNDANKRILRPYDTLFRSWENKVGSGECPQTTNPSPACKQDQMIYSNALKEYRSKQIR